MSYSLSRTPLCLALSRPTYRTALVASLAASLVSAATHAHAMTDQQAEERGLLVLITILAVLYFIPSIVAFARGHPNRWVILVINLLLGGTGLGWLGALIWAAGAVHRSVAGSHGGESGLNIFVNDPVKLALPSSTPSEDPNPADQLLKLKALRDQQVITEEEFFRLRQPYLDRLLQ